MSKFQSLQHCPFAAVPAPRYCRTALATQPAVCQRTESGARNLVCTAAPEPKDAVAPDTVLDNRDTTEASQEPAGKPRDEIPPEEVIKFEGSASKAELIISCLLGFSLLYLPLTLTSIGRFLWFRYKLTDRRMILEFNSPIRNKTVQVTYDKVKEVRAVGRGFGLWGDMVIFLKDGSKLELVAVEDHDAVRVFLEGNISL